jgi:hypothetical protein
MNRSQWRKSSHSGAENACVELAVTDTGTGIRDSKHPNAGQLHVSRNLWMTFLCLTKTGEIAR